MVDPQHIGASLARRGRLLGIDYGSVRIGLAVSDPEQKFSNPLTVYHRQDSKRMARYFQDLVTAERIVGCVVGLPIHTSGAPSEKSREATTFAKWLRDQLLESSPFLNLKGGDESNVERQRFIGRELAARVLEACPDIDWRVIFGLARFAGLRCPSEVMGLKWTDIDWAAGRLRIDAPKTGLRFCPMFPEVRAVLADGFDQAAEGAVYVVARRFGENLRSQFNRIVERAGIMPWPKPFCNCRASCRTELQERFPGHVINGWLGQSSAVAEKHYLQTTDEHWQRAVDVGPPIGPPINGNQGPVEPITETKKPRENRGSDGLGCLVMASAMTPTGLEPVLPP